MVDLLDGLMAGDVVGDNLSSCRTCDDKTAYEQA
jgi:hypothetical protein